MELPLILTNFKTYPTAVNDGAVELAKIHDKVAKDTGANIGIAVSAVDIYRVAQEVSIPVYAQHFDPVDLGSFTGHLAPEMIRGAGAAGTLLNHSEHLLDMDTLKRSVYLAKKEGLYTIVCAENIALAAKIMEWEPDMVALEPPDLIGGDVSVSNARPELIQQCVDRIGGENLLVGAGVKNCEDVKKAVEYGACGVLLSSGVTKAEDPEMVLRDLVKGVEVALGQG